MEGRSAELISTRSSVRPQFIYCCRSNELLRASLLTGEQSNHRIPDCYFKFYCRWSELPGGNLLITGGFRGVREVVRIDALREWAVSSQPPMHTARCKHAALYHYQYLYVLGGYNDWYLSECERYSCAESRWEELPVAGEGMSAVEVKNSLYALGGLTERMLDTVQKLSLDSLTWELMQLKLPQAANSFACFKTDTQVYLMIQETLYSFTPLQVRKVKTVPRIWCSSSYYSRGTLYYDNQRGIDSLALGI
jgi:hypothetical protein